MVKRCSDSHRSLIYQLLHVIEEPAFFRSIHPLSTKNRAPVILSLYEAELHGDLQLCHYWQTAKIVLNCPTT